MKNLKQAVSVAILVTIGLPLSVIDSHARRAIQYEPPKMPDFTSDCQQLTRIRTRVSYRIDHAATAKCVTASEEQWRQQQLEASVIEANKAQAELDRELARKIRTR